MTAVWVEWGAVVVGGAVVLDGSVVVLRAVVVEGFFVEFAVGAVEVGVWFAGADEVGVWFAGGEPDCRLDVKGLKTISIPWA